MARGSKNIKPKRNKTVRSSKRARKKHPDKMKKKFTNEAVKQNWDPRKTVKQNYAKLGLELNPNERTKILDSIKGYEDEENSTTFFNVDEIRKTGGLPVESNKKRVENYVAEEERNYLESLIAKHGEDYTKMSRDIKTNKWQWTEQKLRRRCERLKAYKESLVSKSTENSGDMELDTNE